MAFERASGVLLHPTSLPGRWGIGDLGPAADRWLDWLAAAEQKLWQVLPLGPTGYGDSPYSCHSAFAGNPLLISPERLVEQGLLTQAEIDAAPDFPVGRVDYGWVIGYKRELLQRAYQRYASGAAPKLAAAAEELFSRPEIGGWAYDYALFAALKEHHDGAVWNTWDPGAAFRDPEALAGWRVKLADAVGFHLFCQFIFRSQWTELKQRANGLGISIVGDIPIFVAYDSADVWCNRHLFQLEPDGTPLAVAGVPPDYFAATGQLWGNPLYDWPANQWDNFGWWFARFRNTLSLVDAVRLDHFRGFESYWRVPAGETTAIGGEWVKTPGDEFFVRLWQELGDLSIIAEDLGIITPEVKALRDRFGFPGMRVLQFAFHKGANFYLPHLYPTNTVVYTGTHDNDTTRGWWKSATKDEKTKAKAYLGSEPKDISWSMIRLALGSAADVAIFPLQDALGLGSEARMNTPGVAAANWSWRMSEDAPKELAARLADLVLLFDRGKELPELM